MALSHERLRTFADSLKAFWAYQLGSAELAYLPTLLWIEPVNYCNLRCAMCPVHFPSAGEKKLMEMGLFRRVIDQVPPGRDVNLFLRGEPLLHPDIFRMTAYCRERRIRTHMRTNATKLGEKEGRAIIESGLDVLSIVMGGLDRESYESRMRGAEFSRVLSNAVLFLKLKGKLRSKIPYCVLTVYNNAAGGEERKKDEILSHFRGLPLEHFNVRQEDTWCGSSVPSVRPDLEARRINYIPCTMLWYSLSVFSDGTAVPCCFDVRGDNRVGDLNEGTIHGVWTGKELSRMRYEFARCRHKSYKTCAECMRIRRRTFLGVPVDYVSSFLRDRLRLES